jgi:hypothetical protein
MKKEMISMENQNENDSRNTIVKFRLNKDESEVLEKKFRNSGYKSKSEFIRMMIFQGLIIKVDDKTAKDYDRNLVGISNNINQIARRVNSTGKIYAEDIEEIQNGVKEIWQQLKYFQSVLQKAKPLPISPTPQRPTTDD